MKNKPYNKSGYFNLEAMEHKNTKEAIKDIEIKITDYKNDEFKAYKKSRIRARKVKYEIKD